MTRVLVIGLDALSPDLVERWRPELPNLGRLMQNGIYGPLASIIQPITPAAWTAMISGRNPGHFGFTDFTYRGRGYGPRRPLLHALPRPRARAVLSLLDVPAPDDVEGRPIHVEDDVYSVEDEAELTSRLRTLYLE